MNSWLFLLAGFSYLALGSAVCTALDVEDRWLAWLAIELFWPWVLAGLLLVKLVKSLQDP